MGLSVLIANSNAGEAHAVASALLPQFSAQPVGNLDVLLDKVAHAAALVLDSNFSESQGVDVLMSVLVQTQLPILMITPDDDPLCAVEAMRCGAASYLVKTGTYVDLLPTALQEVIQRGNAIESLKQEIVDLRKRNAVLEGHVKPERAQRSVPAVVAPPVPNASASLEESVAARMRSGQIPLPAYPQVATKLRELLQTDVGIPEVSQLLSQDAAVSAKLLRVANASQYANLRKVESVEGAVSRIGLSGACNVAQMVSNKALYATRNAGYRALLEELWLHSMACAHACALIGQHAGNSVGEKLFSLGLLHDVGKLALLQAVSQGDPQGARIEGPDRLQAFQQYLEQHHVECGLMLVRRWNFDKDFHLVVRYHDNLAGADPSCRPLMIVHLANLMARNLGYGQPLASPEQLYQAVSREFLFPGDANLDALSKEIAHTVETTRKLLA